MLWLETVPGRLLILKFQNIYCTVFQTKVSPPRKRKLFFFLMFQDSLLDSSTFEGVHSLHIKQDSVCVTYAKWRRVSATTVAGKNKYVLHIMSMCS